MTKLHSHTRTWEDKKNLNIKFLLWPLTAPHSALWMCIMHGPDLPNQQEYFSSVQFSPVTQLCPSLCDLMDCSTPGPPCPSPTPGIYSNSCPSSRWCHPTTSSSVVPFSSPVIPFSSHLQSFPASESFQMSQFFESGGQSIGASASTSVLPMNIKDWFPLGLTGWISLQSKGLSRVFSNTTVQKHQFFSAKLSL